MERLFVRIVGLLITVCIITMMTVGANAFLDSAAWNDADLYVILDEEEKSNNDLKFASVKVKYDYDSNRVKILFMLEFNEIKDVMKCGVRMNFNNLGTITLLSDGTAEFDPEIYYAALDEETSDIYTGSVGLEVTVGIKDGIPEKLVMAADIIDSNGIRSNTFNVDITQDPYETDKNSTEGEQTTKRKTTKRNSAKSKTTKVKTTKAKKTKLTTQKNKSEQSKTVIDSGINANIQQDNRRKRLTLAFGVSAAVVALTAGTAAAVKSKNTNKDRGHDE